MNIVRRISSLFQRNQGPESPGRSFALPLADQRRSPRLRAPHVVAAVLVFAAAGFMTHAADEFTVAGTFSDVEHVGESAQINGELVGELGKRFLVGPSLSLSYDRPERGESVSGTGLGAVVEYNLFNGNNGPFIGAQGLYWIGEKSRQVDYQASARAGFKFGGDSAFVKIFASKTRRFADHGKDVDSIDANVGIGLRF